MAEIELPTEGHPTRPMAEIEFQKSEAAVARNGEGAFVPPALLTKRKSEGRCADDDDDDEGDAVRPKRAQLAAACEDEDESEDDGGAAESAALAARLTAITPDQLIKLLSLSARLLAGPAIMDSDDLGDGGAGGGEGVGGSAAMGGGDSGGTPA